mmetsp:Transcript_3966/g.8913  ORF Transcript_3966/g.8913 Transcript_3966/m.8913 type:complete len:674 (+) Transcript_3966:32-2053(+)
MAFDRPIEADSVDDMGLLGSLIRAPVVGIMWLLGGEHREEANANEEVKQKHKNEQMERELRGGSNGDSRGGDEEADISADVDANGSSNGFRGGGNTDTSNAGVSLSDRSASSQPINQVEVEGHDKENKKPLSPQNWPSTDFLKSSDGRASNVKSKHHDSVDAAKSSTERPLLSGQSPRRETQSTGIDCPATQIIDDLATAMESSRICSDSPGSASAALSQSKMTASSTDSLSASYSASTFSDHHNKSQTLSIQSSVNTSVHISQASNLRGSKKMSWSDECGNRSLVEYFDEKVPPSRSNHWSAMRRNSWRASRHSFDGGDKTSGTRRSEVRVIKSALRRSGSYSPPVALYARNSSGVTSFTSSSTDSSCTTSSSSPEMRSFRSLSVIGSDSSSAEHVSKESMHSHETQDSLAAVTNKKLNSNEVQCVPSTLQVGCGRASGGLIIPRGGPADSRYYFPRGGGGPNDSRYQVILGTGMPGAHGQETKAKDGQDETKEEKKQENEANEKVVGSPNPASAFNGGGGRSSPGHHHHFLPRHHTNGYISPQYGFYVNITPPTPELYAARNPLKSGEKPPRSAVQQQQSYQQFQYQSKYQAPSPIPEGSPGGPQGIPQRFVGKSSVPRPSSNKTSSERQDQMTGMRKNSLKPTFTKNKKGMGMLLAENPHHGVWPTVPFG